MRKKKYIVDYEGHEIRVVYRTLFGAKLYVDGECKDICRKFFAFSAKTVFLSTVLTVDGEKRQVEVFVNPLWIPVRMKICVDGKRIGGEEF